MGGTTVNNGVYADTNDVWSSSDGVAWTQVAAKAQWTKRDGFAAVTFNNKMWVMGGCYSDNTNDNYYNDVWSSTDGKTWTQVTAKAAWPTRFFFSAVVFDNKMWVLGGYAGQGDKVLNDAWCSTDGVNWTQATGSAGWTQRCSYGTIAYNNKLWIMGGMSKSTGYLNDVWYADGTAGIDDQMHKSASENILLKIINADPFHSSVQIRFRMQQASSVGISISNSAGREVALVCSGTYAVGTHTVTWNGLTSHGVSVPCGIYFVRYEAGGVAATQKIIMH